MGRPKLAEERTLILIKPDVIQRQIVGEILTRFERKGYKVIAMKMLNASKGQVGEHYIDDESYLIGTQERARQEAIARGDDMENWDSLKRGKLIREKNIAYLTCGPIIAIVLEGPSVITGVRKLLGSSNPSSSDVGTIRADYSIDSYDLADQVSRSTRTMLHASDSVESAEREILIWFGKEEVCSNYETVAEKIFYDSGWDNA